MLLFLALLVFFSGCESINIQCDTRGEISGIILKTEPASSYEDCLHKCKDDFYCQVFTFYESRYDCAHFLNATSLDSSCSTCKSGNRNCSETPLPTCQIAGRCIGESISITPQTSEGKCLRSCKDDELCEWYAYDGLLGDCLLLKNCLAIDDTCLECSSGQKVCTIGLAPDYEILLVVGGETNTSIIAEAEILDLSEQGRFCKNPPVYPEYSDFLAGTYINQQALVCGGNQLYCYEFEASGNRWIHPASTTSVRDGAASTNLNETHWLLSGGRASQNSWEIYDATTKMFSERVDFPVPRYDHFQVFVNASCIFVIGGANESTDVLSFSSITRQWKIQPNFNEARSFPFAGRITYPDQSQAIVMGGGYDGSTSKSSTEIFSLDTQTWRPGPILPFGIMWASVVQYKNTFLLVGGYAAYTQNYWNSILLYDVENDQWINLSPVLSEGKIHHAAFLVPDSFCS